MYVTVYSPGGISIAGDFRATFQNVGSADPLVISEDTPVTIADSSLVLHQSSYDPVEKIYTVPFTISAGALDGNHISIGLYLLLGATTENLKLLSVEKKFDDIDTYILGAVAALVLFLLLR